MGLSFFSYSGLVNSLTSLILGCFFLFKNYKSVINRSFAYFAFSVSWWSFFYFLWLSARESTSALYFFRVAMVGVIIIPVAFIYFITNLLGINIKKKYFNWSNFTLSGVFILFSFSPICIRGVEPRNIFPFWPIPGFLFHIMLAQFFLNITYAHILLWKEITLSSGVKRNQLKYVFLGTLFGFIGGSTNYFLWYNIPIPPYLNFLVSIYVLSVAYAIFKYHLLDIRLVLTRASIFVLVYTVVLGIPFALGIWLRPWMSSVWGVGWWMAPLTLMAIFATAGPFIYIYLNKRAEEEILKEQRRYQDTLKRASLGMTRVRDINKLLKLIVYTVARAVRLNHVAIYVLNKEANGYILGSSRGSLSQAQSQVIDLQSPLVRHLSGSKNPLLLEELTQNPSGPDNVLRFDDISWEGEHQNNLLKAQLYTLSASVVIPSFIEDDLLGFMVLGEKRSGSIYTEDDLRVFTVLASQAGLAIENARFFESAQETQEQISQAEKMATLGTMADGLSHQMNNRFHAMSLIASDALDSIKSFNAKDYSPEIKELLSYLEHSAERIKANSLQGGILSGGCLNTPAKAKQASLE